MRSVFSRIGALRPGRSVFNLNHEKLFDCDMGQLIPILALEMSPGDVFKIGNQIVIRFKPLVAPILHPVDVTVHYFAIPYRLLWPKTVDGEGVETGWEHFITGGVDGDDAQTIPTWNPISTAQWSLWDYFGFPNVNPGAGARPLDFLRRAYNLTWTEYYRDQNLEDPIELTDTNEAVLNRKWEKDYFTSAMEDQQRGTPVALPVTGSTSAVWAGPITNGDANWPPVVAGNSVSLTYNSAQVQPDTAAAKSFLENNTVTIPQASLNANTVSLAGIPTFTVEDFRLATQIQKWMERNMRGGVRYIETLMEHFGVAPRDERMQRPEYIGGSKAPVIFSEVLQTSESNTTPQGTLAGHGISVSQQFCGKYRATEFGLILGLMCVRPKSIYQQGINRQWLRETRYDFLWPEFAHLGEQAVFNEEIFVTNVPADNRDLFGYQGRYNELRYMPSMVCGSMRSAAAPAVTYDFWHLGRYFAGPAAPLLNAAFVTCNPDKRIFAVQDEPGLIVSFGNLVTAIRPLPIEATPGLIDHF